MKLGLFLGITVLGGSRTPALSLSTITIEEQGAQAADVLVFTRLNSTNPGAVSISNVSPTGALQMNADGVTLEYGATSFTAAETPFVTFTASYSDDNGGPYTFPITLFSTQIRKPVGGDFAVQFIVPPDETAPTVSNPTRAAFGSTGFTGGIDTSEPGSVRYVVIPNAATNPTITQIEAGTDGSDTAAPGGTRTATAASATTVAVSGSGLTANTTYKIAFAMRDNANNPSNVSVSASFTTAASAVAPSAFTIGMWSVADLAANGQIRITISSLPSDGGSAITAIQYRIDGGTWTSTGLTGTGTKDVTGLTNAVSVTVELRAVNAIGNGSASDVKNVTPTAMVPSAMSAPTLTSTATRITITKASDPADNGSAITGYKFQVSTDGGSSWSSAQTLTSPQTITGYTPGATGILVQTLATNGIGDGGWSSSASIDMKSPTLVGKKTFNPSRNSTDNNIVLTDLTGGIASAPAAGDIVLIAYATGGIANRAITVLAGDAYTTFVSKIYQNNTEDLNLYTGYKIMGGTPDTSVNVTGTLNSSDAGAIVIQVWRYIDPTTPLDVTTVSTSGSGGQPVPGAITPTSQHAVIVVMGGGAGVTCVDFTSSDLSNFTVYTGNGTHDAAVGMGTKDWTSGSFTAATFGGGEASASNARAAVVAALRPY